MRYATGFRDLYRHLAAALARRPEKRYLVGALGVSPSQGLVYAVNQTSQTERHPATHAERRLLRRAPDVSTLLVARVSRTAILPGRPCATCKVALRIGGVRQVLYGIGPGEYGVLTLD